MGNQDWLHSSNDFRLASRKNLQFFSKLWTNSKSSSARSGPDYPLRFATVKCPIQRVRQCDDLKCLTSLNSGKLEPNPFFACSSWRKGW